MDGARLYIIVPWFNESDVVDRTTPMFMSALKGLVDSGRVSPESRLLLVDDGSTDDTPERLRGWEAKLRCIEVLALPRNGGQQFAIVQGLRHAREHGAEVVVTMDCDGQDDPSAIERMVDAFRSGDEVVYGVRNDRSSDTVLKRNTSRAFYLVTRLLRSKIVREHAEFRLMSAAVVDAVLAKWREGMFLRGLVPTLGFRGSTVEYRRLARVAGKSHYSYPALARWAVEIIVEAVRNRFRSRSSSG